MASTCSLVRSFAILLFLVLTFSKVCAGKLKSFEHVNLSTLLPSSNCTTGAGLPRNSSLMISSRYGPCSPEGSNTSSLGFHEILVHDELRVEYLNNRSRNGTAGSVDLTVPTKKWVAGSSNYVIAVGIGTPSVLQLVMFDTGSFLSWVQCQPCSSTLCHPQVQPMLDPSRSSTYGTIPCSSVSCNPLIQKSCTTGGTCVYEVVYGDSSSTLGFLSRDALTLSATDVFQNFVFGCSQNSPDETFAGTSGLFGLGRHPLSLVFQTSVKYGNAFSYCLPSVDSSTGYLTLGAAATPASTGFTEMLSDTRRPYFYYLGLSGISVGGQMLSISPSVFSDVGTIIDSGTVISRLPPPAYAALRSAFRAGMTNYKLVQFPPPVSFDTCYDFTGYSSFSYPTVALHFADGLTLELLAPELFIGGYPSEPSLFCLAFIGSTNPTDVGVLGNVQQRGFEVVYDLGNSRIGFATGTCG